jgi:hypothetical protein
MLTLQPRLTERLWILYAADTASDWLVPGGGVRPVGAGHRVAANGGLSREEGAAVRALRTCLAGPGRYAVVRPVRDGEAPPGPAAGPFAVLAPLAERVFAAATPELRAWDGVLRDPARPAWFAPQQAALVRFMGADPERAITVHLLPSAPEAAGRPWAAFVGVGHRALQCGGPPSRPDSLLEDLLHGAAHGAQPARLDPLIEAFLATPEGRGLDGAFRATPYGVRLRDLPELEDAGLRDLLTEVVVHALVYQGALREAGGLPLLDGYWRRVAASARRALADPAAPLPPGGPYAVWVLGGCAALQGLTRAYLRAGRPVDGAFLQRAVADFEEALARWRRSGPRSAEPPGDTPSERRGRVAAPAGGRRTAPTIAPTRASGAGRPGRLPVGSERLDDHRGRGDRR